MKFFKRQCVCVCVCVWLGRFMWLGRFSASTRKPSILGKHGFCRRARVLSQLFITKQLQVSPRGLMFLPSPALSCGGPETETMHSRGLPTSFGKIMITCGNCSAHMMRYAHTWVDAWGTWNSQTEPVWVWSHRCSHRCMDGCLQIWEPCLPVVYHLTL